MATRLKAPTLRTVPQNKDECAQCIRSTGDLQREFERNRSDMNDAIAAITQQYDARCDKNVLVGEINSLGFCFHHSK